MALDYLKFFVSFFSHGEASSAHFFCARIVVLFFKNSETRNNVIYSAKQRANGARMNEYLLTIGNKNNKNSNNRKKKYTRKEILKNLETL